MTEETDLVVGAFYWVMPANDPDIVEKWEWYAQPARFYGRSETGALLWQTITGGSEPDDWHMRWIGPRMISPMGDDNESQRIAEGNNRSEWV